MATSVVALALRLDGRELLSDVMVGIAGAAWVAVAALLLVRAGIDPGGLAGETGRPRALTLAAGSAVLGSDLALAGRTVGALALWSAGVVLWCWVLGKLVRRPPRGRDGFMFLPAVATHALAALAATLAVAHDARWMARLAVALVLVGLGLYLVALARFHPRQLRDGGGEIWIAGGALAVGALACADLVSAIDALGVMQDLRPAARGLDLGVWIAAIAWLPVLLVAEARWPRPGYSSARWATAFPFGMYAACSFATGAALDLDGITEFARVWVWVALAVWALTALGLARRARAGRPGRRARPGPRPRASG